MSDCNNLADGTCGLSDGSSAGDWRLPNLKELLSLVDSAYYNPPLSNDAGTGKWGTGTSSYTDVVSAGYWSSTTCASSTDRACVVSFGSVGVSDRTKTNGGRVWPVRGGQ